MILLSAEHPITLTLTHTTPSFSIMKKTIYQFGFYSRAHRYRIPHGSSGQLAQTSYMSGLCHCNYETLAVHLAMGCRQKHFTVAQNLLANHGLQAHYTGSNINLHALGENEIGTVDDASFQASSTSEKLEVINDSFVTCSSRSRVHVQKQMDFKKFLPSRSPNYSTGLL